MSIARTIVVAVLIVGLASASFAGDLRQSMASAAAQQQPPQAPASGGSKALMWAGGAVFVGGMAVGLVAFINNRNGEFTEFGERGEANSTNKPLGATGISVAFVGGMMMYAGTRRAQRSPSVVIHSSGIGVVKQLSW